MDRKEILETVIYEMTEKSLEERRESCDEMEQQLYQEMSELSKRRQQVMETLPQEKQQVLESYLEKVNLIADHECRHLYVQGAKDCVKLLKKLGVF